MQATPSKDAAAQPSKQLNLGCGHTPDKAHWHLSQTKPQNVGMI
jgi:hypothetical protein